MLFALRSGIFSQNVVPSFTTALKAVVKANFSTEVVRALATFVTSFSRKGKSHRNTISAGNKSPVRKTFAVGDEGIAPKMSRKRSHSRDSRECFAYEVVVLEMLVDVLLSPERRYINKFATTITSKVLSVVYGF